MAQSFDLIVVGGGPGGYVAAIRAAQLKMKVALVEREHLGGICLNWGCIPTKALLRSAEVLELMRHAASFGLAADNPRFDAAAVVKRSRGVAQQLSRGVGFLLKKNKVTVFDGEARLAGKGRLAVKLAKGGEETLEAKHIILATGARARQLPGLETDGKLVWSYKEAMVPEKMPKSCWWWARARSASSSRASTARWTPRSPWSRCCRACSPWRTRRSRPSPRRRSRSGASRSAPTPRSRR